VREGRKEGRREEKNRRKRKEGELLEG